MEQKLEELKVKYKAKIISNDDMIYGNVMTDIIPYDNRYFTLSLIDELFDEVLKEVSKYGTINKMKAKRRKVNEKKFD